MLIALDTRLTQPSASAFHGVWRAGLAPWMGLPWRLVGYRARHGYRWASSMGLRLSPDHSPVVLIVAHRCTSGGLFSPRSSSELR
jgi:hypothetical protein